MYKLIKSTILFFILIVTVTSCITYKSIELDVLRPAEYTIEPVIKNVGIAFLSQCDTSRIEDGENIIRLYPGGEELDVDSVKYEGRDSVLLHSLTEELLDRNFYDTIIAIEPSISAKKRIPLERLLFQVCVDNELDGLVVFKKQGFSSKMFIKEWYDGLVTVRFKTIGRVDALFYNAVDREINYQFVQSDTLTYKSSGATVKSAGVGMPTWRNGVLKMAGYQGSYLADRFAPYWSKVEFVYYIHNFDEQGIAHMVEGGQWGEAIKIWKAAYVKSRGINKGRLAYNLAFASYALGDFVSADFWVEKSKEKIASKGEWYLYDQDLVQFLDSEIDKRLKELSKIKEQYGGY